MVTFIVEHANGVHFLVPWPEATPSDRKRHRQSGRGFTIVAKDEAHARRTLTRYNLT